MKFSQIEKRIPQTLINSKDIIQKDRQHARRSSRGRSTRGQENEAWALYQKNQYVCGSQATETVAVTKMSPFTEKGYFIDTRVINRTTKCATCKTELKLGDIQASTEGPQRTIQRQWIISTFYYCPQIRCITRMPRNGYNQPFCPSKLTLTFSPSLLPERRGSVGLTLA